MSSPAPGGLPRRRPRRRRQMTGSEIQTHTLEVPGAVLSYDVRPAPEGGARTLFLVGSPMGAAGFASLAARFTDRSVVTYDPRSAERSKRTDGASQTRV